MEVRGLASALRGGGDEARPLLDPPETEASTVALASALREAERSFAAEQPGAVLLADDTDAALAALLVAAKLGVPAWTRAGASSSSSNGRLIAQLADGQSPTGL